MPTGVTSPVSTVPAWQAARDLRMGIRSVLHSWDSSGTTQIAAVKKRVATLSGLLAAHKDKTDELRYQLENALIARRTKEARVHLSTLAASLRREREIADTISGYVADLEEQVNGALSLDLLKHWNTLAQCLPTTEDVPQGREQNVLRAIIAVLRANNIGDLGAMTQIAEDQEGAANGS